MTTAAKTAFGAALWMGPSGGSLVKVAELRSVKPPKMSRGVQDATTHDSPAGAKEVIPDGTYDPGDIAGKVNYVMGSAGDIAMRAAFLTAALQDWKIVGKAASGTQDLEGTGFLVEYDPAEFGVDGLQMADFSIKVSGETTQAAT